MQSTPRPYVLAPGTPALLSVLSGADLFSWYRTNLCNREQVDPRGQRVIFEETDFVHLIKLVDKFGKEPKNRRMTVEQIHSKRISLVPGRFDIRRAQELSWAGLIVAAPTMIVPNWQAMGHAYPGDAYIRNFGVVGGRPVYRVLVCGHYGMRRRAVTIFPRERFADVEIRTRFWHSINEEAASMKGTA